MKHLRLPASYAALSEEEQFQTIGGGEFKNALDSFTNNAHFGDFFMGNGLLSFSVSFVPMLLFKVVLTGYRAIDAAYNKLSSLFGYQNQTMNTIQTVTTDVQAQRNELRAQR